jgi:hypothetical protein
MLVLMLHTKKSMYSACYIWSPTFLEALNEVFGGGDGRLLLLLLLLVSRCSYSLIVDALCCGASFDPAVAQVCVGCSVQHYNTHIHSKYNQLNQDALSCAYIL